MHDFHMHIILQAAHKNTNAETHFPLQSFISFSLYSSVPCSHGNRLFQTAVLWQELHAETKVCAVNKTTSNYCCSNCLPRGFCLCSFSADTNHLSQLHLSCTLFKPNSSIVERKRVYASLHVPAGVVALFPLETRALPVKINASKSPSSSIRSLCRGFHR